MNREQARYLLDDARAGKPVSAGDIHLALIICGDCNDSMADFPQVEHKPAGSWQVTGFADLEPACWMDPLRSFA